MRAMINSIRPLYLVFFSGIIIAALLAVFEYIETRPPEYITTTTNEQIEKSECAKRREQKRPFAIPHYFC
jgi:hypothetical protein